MQSAFIIGPPRGGTTKISQLFGVHARICSYVEDQPKLLRESRLFYDGKERYLDEEIFSSRQFRINAAAQQGKIYVDKNPSYLPFAENLIKHFNCKLVFVFRDGKEVVRSLIDWNQYHSKSIFCLEEDWPENSSEIVFGDSRSDWDYSRLRPKTSDSLYSSWKVISRFEKCAWYWARFSQLALEVIQKWPEHTIQIHIENLSFNYINQKFEDLGLQRIDKRHFEKISFDAKVNSLESRFDISTRFPPVTEWNKNLSQLFSLYASETYENVLCERMLDIENR